MPCELCQNSYYPESLSGHRWIPNEPLSHYDARFSVQKIGILENVYALPDGKSLSIVYIPRYPAEHHTHSQAFFFVETNSEEHNFCKRFAGSTDRNEQAALLGWAYIQRLLQYPNSIPPERPYSQTTQHDYSLRSLAMASITGNPLVHVGKKDQIGSKPDEPKENSKWSQHKSE